MMWEKDSGPMPAWPFLICKILDSDDSGRLCVQWYGNATQEKKSSPVYGSSSKFYQGWVAADGDRVFDPKIDPTCPKYRGKDLEPHEQWIENDMISIWNPVEFAKNGVHLSAATKREIALALRELRNSEPS